MPIVLQLFNKTKPLEFTKEEFGAWLSGFIDAEGNFQVFFDRKYLRVAFRINLHKDDEGVLHKIKQFFEEGNIEIHSNSCVYVMRNVDVIINKLIPILEINPLRTIKYLDYLDFKKILILLSRNTSTKTKSLSEQDRDYAKLIIQGMNSGRISPDLQLIDVAKHNLPINKFWILGFIEGEGTFGLKNLVPYFQIGLLRTTYTKWKCNERD